MVSTAESDSPPREPTDPRPHALATFARPWRRSESDRIQPEHGFAAFEKPRRFKRLVLRTAGEELISPVCAAALLGRSIESVERQISGLATQ